jgi:phosphoenolpyruvate carboxykinase (GTP)
MAMLPFCGYNMGDYFRHWLNMGKRMAKPPKIFHVNWFRTDEQGEFLWPGFKENLRVLEWILDRCNSRVGAAKTAIGYVPYQADIDITGLHLAPGVLEKLLEVRKDNWLEELKGIKRFFSQFKKDLPCELWQEYNALQKRLKSHE